MEASKIEGDQWEYKRYFFYTVSETVIVGGALYLSGYTRSLSEPSPVLVSHTGAASLSDPVIWSPNVGSTGGQINIRIHRPINFGGVPILGFKLHQREPTIQQINGSLRAFHKSAHGIMC